MSTIGQPIDATFLQGGSTTLILEAIYDTQFPIQGGGWLITTEEFNRLVPPAQQTDSSIYIKLEDGSKAGIEAVRPSLEAIVDQVPGATLQNLTEFKQTYR